mmetsp:Transcript_88131/g.152654  ORF Transcript_88131/g.152654 Transcript_88131/m.152654 type:complete len:90 (-) Transcript_88131:30-299(-)
MCAPPTDIETIWMFLDFPSRTMINLLSQRYASMAMIALNAVTIVFGNGLARRDFFQLAPTDADLAEAKSGAAERTLKWTVLLCLQEQTR